MTERYKFPKTHGLYKNHRKEYRCWQDMKQRCLNPKNASYKSYGGRGITVCERWLESFENFCSDMGVRPERMSIDRINNDLGYSPENCRWATCTQQSRNTRASTSIESGVLHERLTNKWTAYISVACKTHRIGSFVEKAEAILARKIAEITYWENGEPLPVCLGPLRNNTSGFVGVYEQKRTGKWEAYYGGSKNRIHIGTFDSPQAASEARNLYLAAHGIGEPK